MLSFLLRRQHAGQRRFHLVHGFVDDVVVANIDAVRGDQFPAVASARVLKPITTALEASAKIDVGFGDRADAA